MDSFLPYQNPATTDNKLDTESLSVGGNTVHRERIQIAGSGAAEVAAVTNADPAGTEYAIVTRNIPSGTQAVSAASLPLPTGAATEATLSGIKTGTDKIPALGQAAMAASMPVTIASNQSAIPVTGTFWQATQPVSLASLPALAAGSAKVGDVGLLGNTVADGSGSDYHALIDTNGYLHMHAQADQAAATTGTITANGQTISCSTVGYSHVSVSISGTYNTVNIAFEFSDDGGTTWFATQMVRSDANTVETTSGNLTNTNRSWECSLASATHFRVRATAWTSGTATIRILPSAFPAESNMTVAGTVACTQSGNWNLQNWGNIVDNAGFTDGTSRVSLSGFVYDEVAGTALTENDAAAARIDAKRALVGTIEDGTTRGTRATVKAASTAAQAADTSLVVGFSPNSPLPAGTAVLGDTGVGSTTNTQSDGLSNTSIRMAANAAGNLVSYMVFPRVFNGTSWDRFPGSATGISTVAKPTTTGGATPYVLISAASTNATSLKASAGHIYGIQVSNTNAAARYLKLYNKASAPTVGTDTPVKTIIIPGNTAGGGNNVAINDIGIEFTTGIAFALTTGIAHTDTGAVGANEIAVNIDYK